MADWRSDPTLTRADKIAIRRRMQPIAELQRKAMKANPRRFKRVLGGVEGVDLFFATRWREDLQAWAYWRLTSQPPTRFCSHCGRFGRMPWRPDVGMYSGPIEHVPTCKWSPHPPLPYPAGRSPPQP